jgi:hypothetical protein
VKTIEISGFAPNWQAAKNLTVTYPRANSPFDDAWPGEESSKLISVFAGRLCGVGVPLKSRKPITAFRNAART